MAITLVGLPVENSASEGADVTLVLPLGMAENDVVYVFVGANSVGDVGTSSSGWTALRTPNLIGSSGADLVSQVYRKVMGAIPDVSITLTSDGTLGDAMAAVGYALRGVFTSAPEDATPTTSNVETGAAPDSPSITTVTNGAWVLSFAAADGLDTTVVAPTGYSNQVDVVGNDSADVTVGGATKEIALAGAEDPPAWTTWTVVNDAHGWSVAVRPASTYELDGDAGSFACTGTAATLLWHYALAASPGSFEVTGADVTLNWAATLSVDGGSFAVTGTNTDWHVFAGSGTFGFTGADANLQSSSQITISADAGAFTVTGGDASLEYGFEIVPDAGSYLVTGADISASRSAAAVVDAGSFAFTGENADLVLFSPPPEISNVSHPVAWGPIGGRADPSSLPLMTEKIGAVLACTNGEWTSLTGLPLSYSYQWRRDAVDICDAILNAYTLEQADSGAAIDCMITVTDGTHTEEEDTNNIICETLEFRARTRYRKVTRFHSGGTLVFTNTLEDEPCDPDPAPEPNPDPDPDPDPGEDFGFIIDANDDFVIDDDSAFLTDASQ